MVGPRCPFFFFSFFFFNDTATTEIYTLSLHDALPISDTPRTPSPPALRCNCLSFHPLRSWSKCRRPTSPGRSTRGAVRAPGLACPPARPPPLSCNASGVVSPPITSWLRASRWRWPERGRAHGILAHEHGVHGRRASPEQAHVRRGRLVTAARLERRTAWDGGVRADRRRPRRAGGDVGPLGRVQSPGLDLRASGERRQGRVARLGRGAARAE